MSDATATMPAVSARAMESVSENGSRYILAKSSRWRECPSSTDGGGPTDIYIIVTP